MEQLEALLASSTKITIVAHKSPDGDSVGSSMGLYHYLKKKGKQAQICHPDALPSYLSWLDPQNEILNFEENSEEVKKSLLEAELIFCLDFNDLSRVGQDMMPFLSDAKAKKIMVDHHQNPSNFADIIFSEPSSCSTSQLIAEMIEAFGDAHLMDEKMGTPLYCGIMTDTGSFRFPSTSAKTHRIIAHLMDSGVKNYAVHEQIYDRNTLDRLRLQGFVLNEKLEVWEELHTAVITLNEVELKRFAHQKGDTEGFVNIALSIEGMYYAAIFIEKEGAVKISFRSKGVEHPVNELAATYFNGGGHINAAGGRTELPIEEAVELFRKIRQNEK